MNRRSRGRWPFLAACLTLVLAAGSMGADEGSCVPVPVEPPGGVDPDPVCGGDCPDHRPHCDELRGVCVECLADADCAGHPAGERCDEHVGACGDPLCTRDEECAPPTTICSNAYDLFRTGFCVPGCAPFEEAGGCAGGAWCFPSMRTPGAGMCTPNHPASLPAGAACEQLGLDMTPGDCAPGHMCWQPDGEARCFLLCDPAALPGGAGDTCGDGERCRQLQFEVPAGTRPVAFGVCAP